MAGRIHIGCSGWNYDSWRHGVFYPRGLPARRWLAAYAEHFDTVEVNTTFYRLPRRDAGLHLGLLLARIEPLARAGKLGPLLWQLPPTFTRDDERLSAALAQLPRELEHAFEFRHASWFAEPVMTLLREHGVALVVADRPEIRSFQTREPTAAFAFIRFHYGTRGRRGNYSESELREWSRAIAGWAAERDVYAYFNNDWEGFAPHNAAALKAMLGA
jgi:uncharacterized protein YecE (DUF72 family)